MSMVTKKYAAIDIGSNAVRLMIMLVHQTNESTFFKKVSLTRVPIRLGEDVFLKNKISRRNISRMIHAMKAFHHLIKLHEVINYSACATSAMRDSTNGTELVETIFEQTGLKINVISGKEEAEIIYQMHIEEKIDASKNYVYIDIGGGSTEITIFEKGVPTNSKSFNIGTIRLLHSLVENKEWDDMKSWFKTHVAHLNSALAIGSGGNVNRLHKMAGKTYWATLDLDYLKKQQKYLGGFSYEDRVTELNMNMDRADVIMPALKILIQSMKWSKCEELIVPKMGLADGLVRRMHAETK